MWGSRLVAALLLVLVLAAVAGGHTHDASTGSHDGSCLACALWSSHGAVAPHRLAPVLARSLAVRAQTEAPEASPTLPDPSGRAPPRLPAA